jgi:acyl-CoA hydrolase
MNKLARHTLLLFILAFLAACSASKEAPIPHGATVLVLGDSLSSGHTLGPDQAWPRHLATESGWDIVNAGISGDTTAGGLARLPALLDQHRPAAVFLELGGNDMLRKVPQNETVNNLRQMIAAVRAAQARPVLVATPRPSVAGAVFSSLADAEFYAELARQEKLPLVEEVISETLSEKEFKLDQLHPNAQGHAALARAMAKQLRKKGLLK